MLLIAYILHRNSGIYKLTIHTLDILCRGHNSVRFVNPVRICYNWGVMKRYTLFLATILVLFLGSISITVYAQNRPSPERKPAGCAKQVQDLCLDKMSMVDQGRQLNRRGIDIHTNGAYGLNTQGVRPGCIVGSENCRRFAREGCTQKTPHKCVCGETLEYMELFAHRGLKKCPN